MTTELRWGAATDVGLVRTINQDRMLCEFPVFMVADGMGGHTAGEVAAQLAVDTMRAELQNVSPILRQDVANAVMTANHLILTEAEIHPDYRGMGTTITGICVTSDPDTGDEQLTIVNVGDSRTYVLRMGELIQLTKDDSVVGEMIRLGLIDESEAETHAKRHMVTRALGVAEDLVVSTDIVVPLQGERFLICSDGLLREVPHNQVAGVLRRINDPAEAAKELVTMAVAKGGSDNTTVVIVDVANDGGRAQRASGSVPTPLTGYGADLDAVTVDAENGLRTSTVLANATTPAAPTRKTAKPLVTWRVVALIVALLVLLAGAYLGLGLYATSGAVITVDRQGEAPEQQLLVVSKGRQGGVLWWDPQVVSRTGVSLAQLRPEDRQQFLNGRQVASVETATQLIANLQISAGSR
jgi:serine/threonine protein phosphatase PrpC